MTPTADADDRTPSTLEAIEDAYSKLPPEAQAMLLCLAPFTAVVYEPHLEAYPRLLEAQPALADLPFERWSDALAEAAQMGLLAPDRQADGLLRLQPVASDFLRGRLAEDEERRSAVEAAFRALYDGLGRQIAGLLMSKEPEQRELGQAMAWLEVDNLTTAVDLGLAAQASILNPFGALSGYLNATQDHQRGLELGKRVLAGLDHYPDEALSGELGAEYVGVIDDIARRQLSLKRYAEAEASYGGVLALIATLEGLEDRMRGTMRASVFHQLGMVALEQRQWDEAERRYRAALGIYAKLDDRHSQAATIHQLGMVAQGQGRWAEAERTYRQALAIYDEFDDRYHQGAVYHQLGILAGRQGRWDEAERLHQRALAIYGESGDRYRQAGAHFHLGIVDQEQRRWDEAKRHYWDALGLYLEFDDTQGKATTYAQLGLLGEARRDWVQARAQLLMALSVTVEANDQYNIENMLALLARVWRASGDDGVPVEVAKELGISAEEAEARLRQLAPKAGE